MSRITGLDRCCLIGGFLEAEPFGEELVVVRLEAECVARSRRALRVDIEQLGRRIVRLLRRLLLRLLPLAAAELVQRRGVGGRAAVAADEVQVRDRDVQLRVVGVDELQELVGAIAQIERQQAEIAADAVLFVHDRIADAHLRQIAHHRVDIRTLRRLARRAADDAGVQLGFRHEGQPPSGHAKPDAIGAVDEHHALDAPATHGSLAERREQPVFGEVLLHRLAAAGALGDDRDAQSVVAMKRFKAVSGSSARDRPGRAAAHSWGPRCRRHARRGRKLLTAPLNASAGRNSSVGGSSGRALSPRSSRSATRCPARSGRSRRGLAMQRDTSRRRQVIGDRRRRVEEKRQVVFDAAGDDAVRDVLVQRRFRRVAFEHFAKAACENACGRHRPAEIRAPAANARSEPDKACAAYRRRTS
jgi:hypothetical protein